MPRAPRTPQPDPPANPEQEGAAPVKKGDHNPYVHALLEDAQALKERKAEVLKEIDDNRQSLRMIARTGFLSTDQGKAVEAWYPLPNRKRKDDQEEGTEEAPAGDTPPAPENTEAAA